MENLEAKAAFLQNKCTLKMAQLDPQAAPLWGKMNAQQMVEHVTDYVRIGSGKDNKGLVTPEEQVPKYQEFLKSEKPFRENTGNPIMPDIPVAVRHQSMQDAVKELQSELDYFFERFNKDPHKQVTNPIFGTLDYDMSVQLLHKHITHHLRQFGINE